MVRNRLLSASALTPLDRSVDGQSAVNRTTTGIPGLDQLIEGGFPANRAIVVCGGTGTGKTSFGLQFLADGIERGEAGIFVSVDEKPRHLLEDASVLGLDLEGAIRFGALLVLDASPYFTATRNGISSRAGIEPRHVASDLVQQVRTVAARRLVIDSLTSLVPPDMSRGQAYDYLRSLIQSLEDNLDCTILLTCRPSRLDLQEQCEAAKCLASGVIELWLRRRESHLVRTLSVRKMRGTALDLAEHRIQMDRGSGLSIATPPESAEVTTLFRRRPQPVGDEARDPSDRSEAV
jgi:KaiC/GvpD/RAD55 family RecA-like ATPase